jgi:hypothetical protein
MEAKMLGGMFRLRRLTQPRPPKIISSVYRILGMPNPWQELKAVQLEDDVEDYVESVDDSDSPVPVKIDEDDTTHWWADKESPIAKTPYSEMAASFLASVAGV